MLNTPSQSPKEETRISFLFPVIATVLASLFVWSTFIFSRQEQIISLPPDSITKLNPAILKPVSVADIEKNVAQHEVSAITQVSAETIEEKINPNRKIISPKTSEDFEKISAIIEQSGGKVINTNQSTIVVELPSSNSELIANELLASETISSLEVDVPTFILAESNTWNIAKIEAPRAWQVTKGQGIRVGIIDTGIDYNHPELIGRYIKGYDSVSEDNDPMDVHGHGTHVAGIVAGSLNNFGIAGTAPEVNLYGYKAIADNGVGYVSDMIESLDRALADGVQVINMSIGTSTSVTTLENKIRELSNQGVTIIAAAGNTNGGAVMYPAAYEEVISVTATDENDQLASFSSLGGEIAAPGVNIISTLPGGKYGTMSGTSMAAPHVTATIALLLAKGETNPKQTLLATAYDLGATGIDGIFGYGRLQAGSSVAPTSPSPTPILTSTSPTPTPTPEPSTIMESTSSGEKEMSSNAAQIRRRSNFSPTPNTLNQPKLEEVVKNVEDNNGKAARTIYRIIEEIFKNQTNQTNNSRQTAPSFSPSPTTSPSNEPETTSVSSPTTADNNEQPATNQDNQSNRNQDETSIETNNQVNNEADEEKNQRKSQSANPSRSGSVRGWTSQNQIQYYFDLISDLVQLIF